MPRVRAVERAVSILRAFTPERPRLGLSDIARIVDLDKATVHRLLSTLEGCGLVLFEPAEKQYSLTYNVVALGAGVAGHADIQQIAEPVLRGVSAKTECLAFLSTFADTGAICVARSFVDLPISVRLWNVGETRPYNQGAAPKLLFAHLPQDCKEAVLRQPLPSATEYTITDPEELLANTEGLVEQRWCHAVDDIVVGLAGLGYGVYGKNDQLIAVVSVSGLTPYLTGKRLEIAHGVLAEAAAEFERIFFMANMDVSYLTGS
ncbi:MAG: IclR family transcriptional regulator [Ectothiorhodospiraceae bacterium]|nr:IclR family transcriptional regulator [Ectothiorhodospiraceae bacterium]